MHFEFSTAKRIIFGPGVRCQLGQLALSLGRKALLVSGAPAELTQEICDLLRESNIESHVYQVIEEPDIAVVQSGIDLAKRVSVDVVIGLGGGSALDTGKAIAALLGNPGAIMDYLEIIGGGKELQLPSLPYIAMPTTAGTGSEVTRNAVIGSYQHGIKVSLRSREMLPRIALVDPELTHSLPPAVTASTGMDALTQLIEPLLSNAANPLTDALCREGIAQVALSLQRATLDGHDPEARENMSLASLLGGLALANARLGAVHGMAGPLGGAIKAPHGVICARLLPIVFESNYQAAQNRSQDPQLIQRFQEVAILLTGDPSATVEQGIKWLYSLRTALSIPTLSEFGLSSSQIPGLAIKSLKTSSMKGNPIQLTTQEIEIMLLKSL